MNTIFQFNPISVNFVKGLESSSNVFNITRCNLEKEKVLLAFFEDEKLGSSAERLDVAIGMNEEWSVLDIEDKVEGYNEIPLGYILSGAEYDKVMVILRRMSNMVLDKKKEGITHYIYNILPDIYEDLPNKFYGFLASNKICIDGSEDMMSKVEKIPDCKLKLELRDYLKSKVLE